MKGVSVLISAAIIIMITVSSIVIVFTVIMPTLNRAQAQATINEATQNMRLLDTTIRQVASEGSGALRSLVLKTNDGSFVVINDTGVEYIFDTDYNAIPAGSIIREGNMKTTTGFSALGLVGYWKFDQGGGTVANDTSGKKFDGTLTNGPIWVSGKYGNAVKFDGINDYIKLPDNMNMLQNVKGTTIDLWVNANSTASSVGLVQISKGSVAATGTSRAGMEIISGTGLIVIARSSDSETSKTLGTSNFLANTWSHAVGVIDYARNTLTIYVNGTKIISSSVSFSQPMTANTVSRNSAFGAADDASDSFFNGTMDEIKIYNRALTDQEVSDSFNMPAKRFRISLDYDNIIIKSEGSTNSTRWGKGTTKICIEKLGVQSNTTLVEVRTC